VNLKFNFYDIYGFALPGFLLLTVFWLPVGLVEKIWPNLELSSALVGIILAYIAGHLLQTVAQVATPSKILQERFPSQVFLDLTDSTFSAAFKEKLAGQIEKTFGLDLSVGPSDRTIDRRRNDAFYLCRSALVKNKIVIYAEQFEGLYALMRGLTAAFAVGVVYYLGWAYATVWAWQASGVLVLAGLIVGVVALIVHDRKKNAQKTSDEEFKKSEKAMKQWKWVVVASLGISAFFTGHYLGVSHGATSNHRGVLIAAAVFSFFAAERCYGGYKTYAQEFAKAVYRDFSNYEVEGPKAVEEEEEESEGDGTE
jgi:hypothetical protein